MATITTCTGTCNNVSSHQQKRHVLTYTSKGSCWTKALNGQIMLGNIPWNLWCDIAWVVQKVIRSLAPLGGYAGMSLQTSLGWAPSRIPGSFQRSYFGFCGISCCPAVLENVGTTSTLHFFLPSSFHHHYCISTMPMPIPLLKSQLEIEHKKAMNYRLASVSS